MVNSTRENKQTEKTASPLKPAIIPLKWSSFSSSSGNSNIKFKLDKLKIGTNTFLKCKAKALGTVLITMFSCVVYPRLKLTFSFHSPDSQPEDSKMDC